MCFVCLPNGLNSQAAALHHVRCARRRRALCTWTCRANGSLTPVVWWVCRSFFGAGTAASTPVKSNKRKAPASEEEDATPVKTPDTKKQAVKKPGTKAVAKVAESPREKRSRKAAKAPVEEDDEATDEPMQEIQAEKEQEPSPRDASDDEDELMVPTTPSPVKIKTKREWNSSCYQALIFELTFAFLVGLIQPGVVAFDSAWWTTRTTATPTCHSQASRKATRAWGLPPAAT